MPLMHVQQAENWLQTKSGYQWELKSAYYSSLHNVSISCALVTGDASLPAGAQRLYIMRAGLAGAGSPFQYYDLVADTYTTVSQIPWANGVGTCMCYDGVDTLYAFAGAKSKTWASYVISTDTWTDQTAVTVMASNVDVGAKCFVDSNQQRLFVVKGSNALGVDRYLITAPAWAGITSIPATDPPPGSPDTTGAFFIQGLISRFDTTANLNRWFFIGTHHNQVLTEPTTWATNAATVSRVQTFEGASCCYDTANDDWYFTRGGNKRDWYKYNGLNANLGTAKIYRIYPDLPFSGHIENSADTMFVATVSGIKYMYLVDTSEAGFIWRIPLSYLTTVSIA